MSKHVNSAARVLTLLATLVSATAGLSRDNAVQSMVDEAAASTFEAFAEKKLQSNQLAVTFIDLSNPNKPRQGSYRGDVPIYPASVIKLFYLAAAHQWLEEGKIQDSEELRRALRDMIVDSSNDATHYIVDLLTATTSGPELPEMKEWIYRRNAVNRHFAALGYTNINANQKPWCEGPYGRDREFVGKNYENRNLLTTDATARLLAEIVLGRSVTAPRHNRHQNYPGHRELSRPMPRSDWPPLAIAAGLWVQ